MSMIPFMIVLAAPPSVCAQDTIIIPSERRCPECRVQIQRVVALEMPPADGFIMSGAQLTRDSRGRYFVAPLAERGEVAVFDARGRFLRTIGKRGKGPGEFEDVRRLAVGPGDSLFISHDGRRVTVYSPQLQYVRTTTIEAMSFLPGQFVVRSDGGILAVRSGGGGGMLDHPLAAFGPDGVATLGYGPRVGLAAEPGYAALSVSEAGIWAAHRSRFAVDLYDPSGPLLRSIRRKAGWFPPPEEEQPGRRPGVVLPLMIGVSVSPTGLLWTIAGVPREKSKGRDRAQQREVRQGESKVRRLGVQEMAARRNYIVEAVDLDRGEVVARASSESVSRAAFLPTACSTRFGRTRRARLLWMFGVSSWAGRQRAYWTVPRQAVPITI